MSETFWRSRWLVAMALVALVALVAACGGGNEEGGETVSDADDTSGGDEGGDGDDGLAVEGLMGSLSQSEVSRSLEPRMQRFAGCFSERYEELQIVGGRIQFSFRVAVDGSVKWVYPHASTIGDRETERCLLGVAGGTRFPEPHGGEAEFSWPIAFDPPSDVRPPFNWEAAQLAETVEEQGESVLSSCGSRGPFLVTLYVAPGGSVMAAGASTTEQTAADALDCVSDAVRAWGVPDPGSYPAKVTVELP